MPHNEASNLMIEPSTESVFFSDRASKFVNESLGHDLAFHDDELVLDVDHDLEESASNLAINGFLEDHSGNTHDNNDSNQMQNNSSKNKGTRKSG